MDEGTGEGGSLELSTGKLVGAMVGAVGELDGFKEIVRTVTSRGVHTSGEEEGEENVFLNRKGGEEVEELKNESDFKASEGGQFIVVKGVEGMSFEVSLARGGGVECSKDMQKSAFSTAAGPSDSDDFARENFQGDATQGIYASLA